jgi:UDP-N-acetylmuramyl tripeptide synthase
VSLRVALESTAARAAGSLSRAVGRGGGTTLPGKLLWRIDPAAVDELAARLPLGTAVVSATNGKTTSTAMAAEVLGVRYRLAWNRSGANLTSGVASTLLGAREAELGLFEVDEFALPLLLPRVAPRVVALGNLFRDQLDRYGELEHIAERWRTAVASLPHDVVLAVNADDPLVCNLATERATVIRYGIDDPSVARATLQHAADSKHCLQCGAPYAYAAAYVGHLGAYRCEACGHARPALDLAARDVRLHGLESVSFRLVAGEESTPVTLPLPGLYNVYNALAAVALCRSLGVALSEIAEGLQRFRPAFGRLERIDVGGVDVLLLLVKNPAGANEAVRTLETGGVPPILIVALNDAIADGRDVSWIWDVDVEPLLVAERIVAAGGRAAELALRLAYDGYPRDRLEVVPDLGEALDRGLSLAEGGTLAVLPTYTAMLDLRAILAARGHVRPYWEPA